MFVSQSGRRGRLLRGLGWPVSVIGAVLAFVMAGSLVGVQADAPAMGIPAQPVAETPAPVETPAPEPSPTPAPSQKPSQKPSTTPSKGTTRPATPTAKPTSKTSGTTAPHGATPSARSTKQP
ncbi:hypothetical protein ACIRBX_23115 [Kitasatospora sp. NPDC096147]|uniref:hypothetical protein n=1 Tax=Kitasatospora sp. NPDC096147 TaxID=3364093 RepID=UPI0037FAA891